MNIDPNDENNTRNEFCIPKLVTLELLHIRMVYETKKWTFPNQVINKREHLLINQRSLENIMSSIV